jgi:hypothetical protein
MAYTACSWGSEQVDLINSLDHFGIQQIINDRDPMYQTEFSSMFMHLCVYGGLNNSQHLDFSCVVKCNSAVIPVAEASCGHDSL